MWIRNDEGSSLVVEDGATYTLTAVDSEPQMIALRPLTTSALLVACGVSSETPARLVDRNAFEEVENTEGLIEIGKPDQDGRTGGYSAPFLRRILTSIDPEGAVPDTVRLRTPAGRSPCNCRSAEPSRPGEQLRPHMVARRPVGHDAAFRADVETPVPAFIRRFGMFVFVPLLQDIIVGFNSTLVIHESIHHLIARNIWCYEGSAIRQKSGYLSVDAELLRGGISRIFHAIDRDRLVIDKRVLSELATIMN